jgi:hypothetical protein
MAIGSPFIPCGIKWFEVLKIRVGANTTPELVTYA